MSSRRPSLSASVSPGEVMLSVAGLRVERDAVVLARVDWVVRRGEHWVVAGPNGSGKSSLLAVVCGYLAPTAGEVVLLGERYGESDWPALRSRVGLVSSVVANRVEPAEPAREVVLSGRYGMINFWGRVSREDREVVAGAMGRAEVEHLADRPWGFLSQGERQRVLVARALLSARDGVLFLDEPCAGLDPVARERFLRFLERFAAAGLGASLVFVTHHVEEIVPAFTHALVLGAGGRVAGCGGLRETLTSRVFGEAFGADVRLRRRCGRYTLEVPPG